MNIIENMVLVSGFILLIIISAIIWTTAIEILFF